MSKSIVNIKYKSVFFIMSDLIKWPTMKVIINNIVIFVLFFKFKLTLLCDMKKRQNTDRRLTVVTEVDV